jgi:putative redox protein
MAAWAERYLDTAASAAHDADGEPFEVVVHETRRGTFQHARRDRLVDQEMMRPGGDFLLDSGPGPYDLLLAALGACTSMTLRLYADRKQIPLRRTRVRLRHSRIHATDCAECETKDGMLNRIERMIGLEGKLDAEQCKRLLEIADKCPVHRTLTSEVNIRTVEEEDQRAAV